VMYQEAVQILTQQCSASVLVVLYYLVDRNRISMYCMYKKRIHQ
jgi:hypothetical protein